MCLNGIVKCSVFVNITDVYCFRTDNNDMLKTEYEFPKKENNVDKSVQYIFTPDCI